MPLANSTPREGESNYIPRRLIKIASPYMGEEIKQNILSILDSKQFVQGKFVARFEQSLSAYLHSKHVIAVNSGTAALHVAFESLKMARAEKGQEDGNTTSKVSPEVITTPLSFAATANSAIHAGCRPVFVDVEGETFNIDPSLIEERINENTLAIEPVDAYGLVANLERILEISRRRKVPVVEDAAESIGASYRGSKVGTISTMTCFSTYATKNLHTGEGGFISTEDDALAEYSRLIRNQGQLSRYNHVSLGYNYRMLEFCAAIGLDQVNKIDELNSRRRKNASFLRTSLEDLGCFSFQKVNDPEEHSWYMFSALLDEKTAGITRDKLVLLLRDRGIEADVAWPLPIHLQPYYRKKFGFKEGDFPIAESIAKRVFQVPVHPYLLAEDLEIIVETIKEILKDRAQ
jgi:perosamine synthetase